MGQEKLKAPGCNVIRLTAKDDLRTPAGLRRALEAVRGSPRLLLRVSIPCTGGCPWQRVNARKQESVDKVKALIVDMEKMWDTLVKVAKENRKRGGKIANEWPRYKDYWKRDDVESFVSEMRLQ